MKRLFIVAASLLVCCAQPKEEYFTKSVTFPEGATLDEKIDIASRLIPTEQQLNWQRGELTAFLHFGMNTFTGREWGDGTENPEWFNPTNLDCEQWVLALKDGGFKYAILTAKHHDGFCLWQTKTTEHSVKNSPWRDGKGDLVREFSEACKKHGLKFGVYLSPWDRNAECYGDSPAYNKFFIEQLSELLTNYGEVYEVWFDGACAEGPNGKRQVYDWQAYLETIHKLQPNAVSAIMGDDVRWVGNEGGLGRDTEWSATVYTPDSHPNAAQNGELGINAMSKDLGSRELVAKARMMYWYPSEVDVSIRPGWFYHPEEDEKVRSVANLVDIYYQSVGCNSVLLLNIPPDKRGLLHEVDVNNLKEFGEYIEKSFADNAVIKGDKLWCAAEGKSNIYKVKRGAVVNTLLLQEEIAKGQRVERFLVEGYINGSWQHITEGTTIGYKRLLRFSDCTPEKIRLTILGTRNAANIANVGLYYAEPLQQAGTSIKTSDIATDKWQIVGSDDRTAIDGNRSTVWSAEGLATLTVDMGKEEEIKGFCYAPTTQDDKSGTIYNYNFYISADGKEWTKCDCSGEMSNIKNNPIPYFVRFGKSYKARYFKFEPTREIDDKQITTIAEIGILQ
ncbi:MAG: alpha-L-fucosidase [Alistipes sp.]|nr:alpha-L-fucosidase [Alistipes sp.]